MKKNSQIINYNPKLKEYAKKLRNNSTYGEIRLWNVLKNKKIRGYDFHRQKPIENYIVDFFCKELMLAIEIDGYSHLEKYKCDNERQKELEILGISLLRFTEEEVLKNLQGVYSMINDWIDRNVHTPPTPSQEGRKSDC